MENAPGSDVPGRLLDDDPLVAPDFVSLAVDHYEAVSIPPCCSLHPDAAVTAVDD